MTRIDINKDGAEFSILCQGHAGYADPGNDIVCSAISILIQTLIAYMDDREFECQYKINSGYAYIYGKNCINAFNVIQTGLELIASNYPKHIKITKGCTIFRISDCD